jgi:phage/plasmid-associated DNA primase
VTHRNIPSGNLNPTNIARPMMANSKPTPLGKGRKPQRLIRLKMKAKEEPKREAKEEPDPEPLVPDQFLETVERFDQHKLNHIFNIPKDELKMLLRWRDRYDVIDPFTVIKNYLLQSRKGVVEVSYKQKRSDGRFCAVKSLSLQTIPREIRHTIAEEFYWDLDMINAHPVILSHMVWVEGWSSPFLNEYIKDREGLLSKLGVDREAGKKVYLSLTNGGVTEFNNIDEEHRSDHLIGYMKEMKGLHTLFAGLHPIGVEHVRQRRISQGKNYNIEAAHMNTLLCSYENELLLEMREFLGSPVDCVLCFDGIMLRKRGGVSGEADYDIKGVMDHLLSVFRIDMKLKFKGIQEGFALNNVAPYVEMTDSQWGDFTWCSNHIVECATGRDVNDNTISKAFVRMMKDDTRVIDDDGNAFMWDQGKKLWLKMSSHLIMTEACSSSRFLIRACNHASDSINRVPPPELSPKDSKTWIKDLETTDKGIKSFRDAIQSVRGMRDMYSVGHKNLRDDGFLELINRQHDLLPLKEGLVIDLATAVVRPRVKTDLFSFECPVEYIPLESWTKEDKDLLGKFVGEIYMQDEEYINYKRIKLGSYLSGRKSREFDMDCGGGKNGKSSIYAALDIILGEFMGYIASDVIACDPKSHKKGSGGHTSHLIPLDGKRLIITQEISKGHVLISDIVKKIVAGDPIEGVREIYGKKTGIIRPFCKLGVSTNFIAGFDADDAAIVDRFNANPHTARFLKASELAKEKQQGKYDPSKFTYIVSNDALVKMFGETGRPINLLFSWMITGCMDFYKCLETGIPKPKLVQDFVADQIMENDPVGLWADEMCVIVSSDDWEAMDDVDKKDHTTLGGDAYDDFSEWAKHNDCHAGVGKQKVFGVLSQKCVKARRKTGFVFQRLRLISTVDVDPDKGKQRGDRLARMAKACNV